MLLTLGPPPPVRITVAVLGALCITYLVMGSGSGDGDFGSGEFIDGVEYLPALPPPPPPPPPPSASPCPPPPPPRPLGTYASNYAASTITPLTAAAAGLLVGPGLLFALTSALEPFDQRRPEFDDRMTCLKGTKIVGLGGLAIVDEVTDVLSCITFYRVGATGFFYASLGILIFASLVGGFFGWGAGNTRPYGQWVGGCFGLVGLSPIVEAVMDVYGGTETEGSGLVKIIEAIAESASQSMLQLFFLTVTTWRKAWTETPVVVVSAAISFLSLSFQFATYPTTSAGRTGGFNMADEYRGRKVTTVALLFYFASDIGLRALALSVFGYAAEGYAWFALAAYVLANAAVAFLFSKAGTAVVCAVGGFLSGILPFTGGDDVTGDDVNPTHVKAEFTLSTLTCASLALIGLYAPWLPHPHVDPTFITATTAMVAAAVGCKVAAFVWYVFPAVFPDKELLSA